MLTPPLASQLPSILPPDVYQPQQGGAVGADGEQLPDGAQPDGDPEVAVGEGAGTPGWEEGEGEEGDGGTQGTPPHESGGEEGEGGGLKRGRGSPGEGGTGEEGSDGGGEGAGHKRQRQ